MPEQTWTLQNDKPVVVTDVVQKRSQKGNEYMYVLLQWLGGEARVFRPLEEYNEWFDLKGKKVDIEGHLRFKEGEPVIEVDRFTPAGSPQSKAA